MAIVSGYSKVRIQPSEYLLVRFATVARPLLKWLGSFESAWLQEELRAIAIDRPVFIAGLARSGSTILLETLASIGLATHRYRDFPFLMTPYLWNRLLDVYPVRQESVERPHRDRIKITRESPEAFEEPIWQAFFHGLHDPTAIHRLTNEQRFPQFESFYASHIKKILLLRKRGRYLSKGNYNLCRIEYLSALFPDAVFIVPVRHPVTHVYSLVREHRLFTDYTAQDGRIPIYLSAAGHYEFGPQRVPINLLGDGGLRSAHAWERGEEFKGYAIQWAEVYGFVAWLMNNQHEIAKRMIVVRYEDFCADPQRVFSRVMRHLQIPPELDSVGPSLTHIDKSTVADGNVRAEERSVIWDETGTVARSFGYQDGESEGNDGLRFPSWTTVTCEEEEP